MSADNKLRNGREIATSRPERRFERPVDGQGNYLKISEYYGRNTFDFKTAKGIPDQVRNNKDGFLIEIDDYTRMSECILEYVSNEDLRVTHGQSAREQAKRFDAKVLSQELEDIILKNLT